MAQEPKTPDEDRLIWMPCVMSSLVWGLCLPACHTCLSRPSSESLGLDSVGWLALVHRDRPCPQEPPDPLKAERSFLDMERGALAVQRSALALERLQFQQEKADFEKKKAELDQQFELQKAIAAALDTREARLNHREALGDQRLAAALRGEPAASASSAPPPVPFLLQPPGMTEQEAPTMSSPMP